MSRIHQTPDVALVHRRRPSVPSWTVDADSQRDDHSNALLDASLPASSGSPMTSYVVTTHHRLSDDCAASVPAPARLASAFLFLGALDLLRTIPATTKTGDVQLTIFPVPAVAIPTVDEFPPGSDALVPPSSDARQSNVRFSPIPPIRLPLPLAFEMQHLRLPPRNPIHRLFPTSYRDRYLTP